MKHFTRRLVAALALGGSFATAVASEEGLQVPPVRDKTTLEECSACHMAFPPALLPARSWQMIMSNLENHFGEDASLDPETARRIEDYLVAHAAESTRVGRWLQRGVSALEVPTKITHMPWFERVHRYEVSARARKRAGSMANCAACHRGAERGFFAE